jgi:hypothetical protein
MEGMTKSSSRRRKNLLLLKLFFFFFPKQKQNCPKNTKIIYHIFVTLEPGMDPG